MPPSFDDATLRRYLLGELPESAAIALEEEYFAHTEVLEQVRGAEDDLIDEYVAGGLAPPERESFERRTRTSPRLRERVSVARALRLLAPESAAPAHSQAGVRSRSSGSLASAPRWPTWQWAGALAAALLLALGLLRWWPHSPGPGTPGPAPPSPEQARLETPAPPLTPTPGPVASAAPAPGPRSAAAFVLALSPLLTRGSEGQPEARIPAHAEVLLELQGEPESLPAGAGGRLELLVTTVEGQRIWTGPARAQHARARPALLASARLPAGLLKPNDYIAALSVEGAADESPPYRYFFRVVE